jgi:hypothetical protein
MKNSPRLNIFTTELYQPFEELMPIFFKLFYKYKARNTLNFFYKASITLIL